MKKLILPLIILSSINTYAQNSYLDSIIENTNEYRKGMHDTLVNSAKGIDNFFDSTEQKIEGYNNTYGLIQLSAFYNEGEGVHFDQKVSIKLKLPKLKKNFKLLFESDEVRENVDFTENHTKNNSDNFNLALLYEDYLGNNVDFKTKAGIKLGSTLNPFIRAEIKKVIKDVKGINYTFSQSAKESVKDKLELTSYIRLDKPINDEFSLHNYYEYYWQSTKSNDSQLYASLYLVQRLSQKNTLTYTLGSNMDNIDSNLKMKRYNATLTYRHWLRKWIFIDTIPENYYTEEEDFKPMYSIKFNLGMYINKDSYRR
ncbi:MAG: hypothetical protein ACERKK_11720 [Poseidonibacter sp.]|uniref:hypothetical protein n=1 Tax=Poseidonibacter sp. TaxID=2321188 RepID=UPI00359E628C